MWKTIELFFDSMAHALANGDRVEIRGLCTFSVKQYKSYAGRNPKTGEQLTVKPKKLPVFKTGTDLKKRVDRRQAIAFAYNAKVNLTWREITRISGT